MRILFLLFLTICCLTAKGGDQKDKCPLIRAEIQRLPDLNIPRSGHMVCCPNGELTVIGGHTDGFVPTATAEYLKDGQWQVVKTIYTHDDAIGLQLRSGRVMLAGGHEKNLGIGQTFSVEEYDPKEHLFNGFGCLDRKRSLGNGVELSNGRVVIAGNWYADDDVEVFDGRKFFSHVCSVSVQRAMPFLFRTADDDVMVIGSLTTRGEHQPTSRVDRIKGDSLNVKLFDTWQPTGYGLYQSEQSMIGQDVDGFPTYLLPVKNAEGQMAIALVSDTIFRLLPTDYEIPMKSLWGPIHYFSPVIVDKKAEIGYMAGWGADNRLYALSIGFHTRPAILKLYYTDILPDSCLQIPVVTPGGNLVFVGGSITDNFAPFKAAYQMCVGSEENLAAGGNSTFYILMMALAAILIVGLICYRKYHQSRQTEAGTDDETNVEKAVAKSKKQDSQQQLMQDIETLVVGRKLYLKSNLRISDIARELGVHRDTIEDCITSQKGYTFIQYVNNFRIATAKHMMKTAPGTRMLTISLKSGFGNESSFYRCFKLSTGMTPKEWMEKNT